jgi:hypothetical protein
MLLTLAGLFLSQSPMPPPRAMPPAVAAPRPALVGRYERRWLPQYGGWAWVLVWSEAAPPAPAARVETLPLPAAAPPQTPCPT